MASDHEYLSLRISADELTRWIDQMFTAIGVPQADGQIVAHVLVEADLCGKHTHGVSRLPLYVERIERGLMMAEAAVEYETSGTAVIQRMNGGNGLGPVVAWKATEHVIAEAKRYGMAAVAVHHSNHCGAMSVYCSYAAAHGMILLALTNSPPGIAPVGGREAFLGTNPIAWGFPRGKESPPLVIDLATSVVARGNIIEAARRHEPIPLGWALDQKGNPTTDAQMALAGAVLPMAGIKGYALALSVEILSGVLSGAGVGPGVKNPYTDFSGPSNVGHFFLAIDPAAIAAEGVFEDHLLAMEADLREVPPAVGGPVVIPGDRSEATRDDYLQRGIPLDPSLVEQLNGVAERLGVGHVPVWEDLAHSPHELSPS